MQNTLNEFCGIARTSKKFRLNLSQDMGCSFEGFPHSHFSHPMTGFDLQSIRRQLSEHFIANSELKDRFLHSDADSSNLFGEAGKEMFVLSIHYQV